MGVTGGAATGDSMPITVNGEVTNLPTPPTLEALIHLLAPPRPFAAALNEDFIPGTAFPGCALRDGDRIEIVYPSAGG